MKAWNLDMALQAPARVTELYLAGRQLERLELDFALFPNLRKLDLSGNRLRALPPSIARLGQLEELVLSGNALTSVPEVLAACRRLRRLVLDGLPLGDLPAWLAGLPALECLSANATRLTSVPEVLVRLRGLRVLLLRGCGLEALPRGVSWPRLEKLDLGQNALRRLPASAKSWSALRVCRLDGNALTRLDVGHWPALEVLNASHNRLRRWPDGLEVAQNLHTLDLSGNRLRDEGKQPWRFPLLRRLLLQRNRLRRPPTWLGACPLLAVLDLSANPVAHWPEGLRCFPRLEELRLAHTRLARLPEGDWQLTALATLDLARTPLSHLPKGWLPAPRLVHARLTEKLWAAHRDDWLRCPRLEGLGGFRRAPTAVRFLGICRKAEMPASHRPDLWGLFVEGEAAAWEKLPFALQWRCLDLPGKMGTRARALFFRAGCALPAAGARWWLAGRLRRGVRWWRWRLEARGMAVQRRWSEEVTHVLVGRGLPEPPPRADLQYCDEAELQGLLAASLPPLAESVRERVVAILRAGQVAPALPLLESCRWDAPVPDAVLVAWHLAPEGVKWKRRLAGLLVERLGPDARTAMKALATGRGLEDVPEPPFDRARLRRWLAG